MAATTTYETAFILGAKYTGGPAFKRFDRDIKQIDRDLARLEKQTTALPKNMAKVTKATGAATKGLKSFAASFAGGFLGGFTAAAIGSRLAQGIKDIGTAAWDAALGVVRARETSEALLKSYGMTITKAHRMEEEFYKVAKASEATGHDAELMLEVMSRLKIIMKASDVKKNIDMWEDLVTVFSDASGPTEESAKAAAQAYVQAVKYNRGPLLKKLGYSKIEIQNMKDLSEQERRALINERMRQKFAGATAQWRATDSGKLKAGMVDIGNVMEDLGEAAVANRGRIGELLSSIAKRTSEIAKTQLGPWFGRKIQEALEYFDQHMPDIIEYFERFVKQAQIIGGLGTTVGTALDAVNKAFGDLGETLGRAVWGDENYAKMQRFWKDMTVESNQKNIDALYAYLKKGLEDSLADSQRQWNAFATWWKTNIADRIEAWFKGLFKNASQEAEKNAEAAWDKFYKDQAGPGGAGGGTVTAAGPEGGPGTVGGSVSAQAAAAVSAATLQSERARIAHEVATDPRTKALLMASTAAEVGTQGTAAEQAYMESVVNRAVALNRSLESILNDPIYYPGKTKRKLGRTIAGMKAEKYNKLIDDVLKGSNISALSTGNESAGVTSGGAGGKNAVFRAGGERFLHEYNTREWVRGVIERDKKAREAASKAKADTGWKFPTQEEEQKAGGKGPNYGKPLSEMTKGLNLRTGTLSYNNNVTAPSTVNINGVDAGNVPALASSVRTSLRSRDREVLEMLKSAKDYELRNSMMA